MNRLSRFLFKSPLFWSGALAGCLLAVLTLAAVSVYAQQRSGDEPGQPAPSATDGAGTAPLQEGAQGDRPDAQPVPADTAVPAPAAGMFAAANAPQAAAAPINTAVTYQGKLTDSGQPADGSFDFRFRLFDDAAAGAQLGEQLSDNLAVQDGLFTAALDFGPDAFSGEALWLEIAVRPAGGGPYETLSPRQAITPAPLALGLPNVSTDPSTGYVSIGGGNRVSAFTYLGINSELENWVGMYVTGGGPASRPFYGYATDDSGSYDFAWTEYNGSADEWQLHTTAGRVFAVSQDGDVAQSLGANGLVKAAAYVECWPDLSFLTLYASFNNVNDTPVTVATGSVQGACVIDFGFDLSGRYFSASAVQANEARSVTCAVDGGNVNRLVCLRWRAAPGGGAEGWGGQIMVQVY